MPGKQGDIRYDHGFPLCRSGPTHSSTELDLETAQRPLIRTHTQETVRLDDSIKPRPQVPEPMVDKRCDRSHPGDRIEIPVEDSLEPLIECRIRLGLGESA